MADSKLLWLLGIGGAAYLGYEWFLAPAAATPAAGSATPTLPATLPATTAPPTSAPAVPGYNSLDQIYQRLVTAMNAAQDPAVNLAGGISASFDVFNYYLSKVSSITSPPTIDQVLGPGQNASATITLANYWSGMSQWLAQNKGLSGVGLFGRMAGMGNYRRPRRNPLPGLGDLNCPGDPGCPGYVDPATNAAILNAIAQLPQQGTAKGAPLPGATASFTDWINTNSSTLLWVGGIGLGVLLLARLAR